MEMHMNKKISIFDDKISLLFNDELPFEMVMVEAGSFDNCSTEDEINYSYNIMPDVVTNAQYPSIYSIKHPEYLQAERNIKLQMKRFAKQIKNEWYEVDLEVAKVRLTEQLDNYFYGECDYEESYTKVPITSYK